MVVILGLEEVLDTIKVDCVFKDICPKLDGWGFAVFDQVGLVLENVGDLLESGEDISEFSSQDEWRFLSWWQVCQSSEFIDSDLGFTKR